jgi:bacillithiol biosynthesis cysteine-adding enzyme BshC
MTNAKRINASLPKLIQNYMAMSPALSQHYAFAPNWSGFVKAVEQRKQHELNRQVLVESLTKQAKSSAYVSRDSQTNIKLLLDEQTFTVTTGHQLGILGGPMFFFYKIMSTIKLAQRAKAEGISVVPVFWLASEDHDFEEIRSVLLGEKEVVWNIEKSGPVGSFLLDEFNPVLEEVGEWLKKTRGDVFSLSVLRSIYAPEKTLSDATKDLVYWLFGGYGIVVVDAADKDLKRLLIPIISAECFQQQSYLAVNETTAELEDLGFPAQVTPRKINLFYMYNGYRERIESNGERWYTVDNKHQWNRVELERTIENSPESFSPNVVLRPIYQELILPNIAYVGGPGELSYWLQLKAVFELYGVFYPQLILRDMVLYLDHKTNKRMNQLGLSVDESYHPLEGLLRKLMEQEGTHEHIVNEVKEALTPTLDKMIVTLTEVYPGLEKSAEAERKRILNRLEKLAKKVWRADRKANEILERRLLEWKAVVHPKGTPQERMLNWLMFFGTDQVHGEIEAFLEHFDPFIGSLLVIHEN